MEQNYTDTLVTRLEKLWKWMSGKGTMLLDSVQNWMDNILENYFTQPLWKKWNQVESLLKDFGMQVTKKVKIYIINRGPIPAFNVKQFSYLSTEKQNFVEWERDPIALGPSEIWNFSVYNPNHLKKFHLGFKLTYDDLEGKNHFFIYEATYDNGIRHGKGHSLD